MEIKTQRLLIRDVKTGDEIPFVKMASDMKKNNPKPRLFLFGCCLFLLVGISCIKPITTNLIREAYIGSAFSFRINDAVSLACPDLETDKAIELQNLVEEHPQLNRVIHRYLRAYADYLTGKDSSLDKLNNRKAFDRMNQDILKETKKRNPDSQLKISDTEFLEYLTLAEEEAEAILQTQVPQNLRNFGSLAVTAIRLYKLLTAFWIQAVLILILLLLLFQTRDSFRSFGLIFLLHGCFWVVIHLLCTKIAGDRLLYITNRILGRSTYIDTTPFLWCGGILVILGVLVFILSSKALLKVIPPNLTLNSRK